MRVRHLALGAAVPVALAAGGPGRVLAQDQLYLGAVNKLEYRRFSQDDIREEAFRNRLEVTGSQGIFTAWIRLEALSLSDAQVYDPYGIVDDENLTTTRVEESRVTRRQLAIQTDHFQAEIGDWAHVFGRGLALSVFEEEELNWDTRLDGARATLSHDYGLATALAGSNEGNRFRGVFVEPRSWSRGLATARVGGSFVEAWGAERNTDIGPREQHWGGLAELVVGPATFYGEYLQRDFPGKDGVGARDEPGRGAFVSGEVSVSGVSLSGEYRDFELMEHEYHDPPTTLRQHTWTLLNRVNGTVLTDIPDDDAIGGLGTLEYAYDYFTTFEVSYARLRQDDGDDEFTEAFGQAKGNWREKIFVTAAAAESELRIGNLFDERITGLGELITHLTERNSLTFAVEWAEVQESDQATAEFEYPVEFRDRIFSLSYGRSPWLTLTATYEDTTGDDPAEDRDEWFNVVADVNLSGHDLSLSYGSERGGWKCTGGVCFFEPEFEGLKVKWTGRF